MDKTGFSAEMKALKTLWGAEKFHLVMLNYQLKIFLQDLRTIFTQSSSALRDLCEGLIDRNRCEKIFPDEHNPYPPFFSYSQRQGPQTFLQFFDTWLYVVFDHPDLAAHETPESLNAPEYDLYRTFCLFKELLQWCEYTFNSHGELHLYVTKQYTIPQIIEEQEEWIQTIAEKYPELWEEIQSAANHYLTPESGGEA